MAKGTDTGTPQKMLGWEFCWEQQEDRKVSGVPPLFQEVGQLIPLVGDSVVWVVVISGSHHTA